MVLGDFCWQRRFGGDPSVAGKKALHNGKPVAMIGVAQKQFSGAYYFLEMDAYARVSESREPQVPIYVAVDQPRLGVPCLPFQSAETTAGDG